VRRSESSTRSSRTGLVVRLAADVLMVNLALFAALAARWAWLVAVEDGRVLGGTSYGVISPQAALALYSGFFLGSVPILTLICAVAFYLSGFYTFGRAYQGRYKALIVAQAVTLSYVAFAAVVYFAGRTFQFPRGALPIAWVLTLALLISARLWSNMWRALARAERHFLSPSSGARSIERILVIGGGGYIGSALLPKLLDKGYHVRLLDLMLYGDEPIAGVIDHPRLEIVRADFRQVDRVTQAMRDVDAVIHLGAIVGDPACALDEDLTVDINLMATKMVAEVAKGMGVNRFIFASTCSVYGASDEVLDERSALAPVSLYARSKIASEVVLSSMASSTFAPVILRFATIYGLSGRTRFDLVVNLLTAKAVLDGEISIFGGDQWRPFLHVDDAALAILTTLEAPLDAVRHQVFNVGSDDQNYTIQQIGDLIHEYVPAAKVISRGSDVDRRNYRVSFAKIRRALDFQPKWTVEGGIKQVMESIASGQVTDYQDAKYSNVKFLSDESTLRLIRRESQWAQDLMNGVGSESESLVGSAS
jgi:nucleoside-diphosphate-sugar epimerase